jgi:hypothetical protein
MPPVAKTNSEDLFEKVNALLRSEEEPTLFELEVLRRQADKLKNVDELSGRMALGAIAVFMEDVEAMRRHHKRTIQLDPTSIRVYQNYGSSLLHAGFFDEGMENLYRADELADHTDIKIKGVILAALHTIGSFHEAQKFAIDIPEDVKKHVGHNDSMLEVVMTILDEYQIKDSDLIKMNNCIGTILHRYEVYRNKYHTYIAGGQFIRDYYVDRDADTVSKMNNDLFDCLAQLDIELQTRSYCVFGFLPSGEMKKEFMVAS